MQWACFLLMAAADPADSDQVDVRCGAYCLYVSLKALDVPVESYETLEARLGEPAAE